MEAMKVQSKPTFPFVTGLTIGALAVAAIMGTRAPATWEECMVANLEKAHSQSALSVLSKYCNAYPRRS